MASTVINTREDLDAIAGTIEHDVFMAALRGTLWRLEKDDLAGTWLAVEDNGTIERFGFTRADFPGAVAPALPDYVPPPVPDCSSLRAAAYREEADPLYFKAQRGEASLDDWKAKVEEIKARWPK